MLDRPTPLTAFTNRISAFSPLSTWAEKPFGMTVRDESPFSFNTGEKFPSSGRDISTRVTSISFSLRLSNIPAVKSVLSMSATVMLLEDTASSSVSVVLVIICPRNMNRSSVMPIVARACTVMSCLSSFFRRFINCIAIPPPTADRCLLS